MKRNVIFGIFVLMLLSVVIVNAAVNSETSRVSNCIRGCTEYKKIDQKQCTIDYLSGLSNCTFNYKICLKQTKNLKNCLKTFNDCKKISNVNKKVCEKNFIDSFFDCKDKCLNPQFKCVEEGEAIPVIFNPPSCCKNLTLIPPREEYLVGISGICTAKCGNGVCDISESNYNCAKDCNENISPETCSVCGMECTTNPNQICPMTAMPNFIAVGFECRIVNGNCIKVVKEENYCNSDADCAIFFSNCGCNNYCKNTNYIPVVDCGRYCTIGEMNKSIDSCKCENNKCMGYKKENKCISNGKWGNTCNEDKCCDSLLRMDSATGGACPDFLCIEDSRPVVCSNDSQCSNGKKCFECHGFVNDGFVPVKHCYNDSEISRMQAQCAAM